jgi:hypothetical protein
MASAFIFLAFSIASASIIFLQLLKYQIDADRA